MLELLLKVRTVTLMFPMHSWRKCLHFKMFIETKHLVSRQSVGQSQFFIRYCHLGHCAIFKVFRRNVTETMRFYLVQL